MFSLGLPELAIILFLIGCPTALLAVVVGVVVWLVARNSKASQEED